MNTRYGINAHLPRPELLDRVAAPGIGCIRVDFNWWMMEPARDQYEWGLTDMVVHGAWERGLQVYATLAYTPEWAGGSPGHNRPPSDPAWWWNFVHNVVRRYGHYVTHWGMWNEPNYKHFWSGSPIDYVNLLLEYGRNAAKAANPNAQICGPDLAHEGGWASWLQTILSRGGHLIDVLTHHCYQNSGAEVLKKLGGPVSWWDRPTVREVIAKNGHGHKPFWLTETGRNTHDVSEDAQADFYRHLLTNMSTFPWLQKVMGYQLIDEGTGWGILHDDFSPKPAYHVVQQAAQGGVV